MCQYSLCKGCAVFMAEFHDKDGTIYTHNALIVHRLFGIFLMINREIDISKPIVIISSRFVMCVFVAKYKPYDTRKNKVNLNLYIFTFGINIYKCLSFKYLKY